MNLMPHQKEGIDWLVANKRGLLWLPPGAGKTLTTLEALKSLKVHSVLIVAPVSLLTVWRDEMVKFYGLTPTLVRGSAAKRAELWQAAGYRVVGYETLRRDFKTMPREWDVIVLDESYKINNHAAKVTKCVLQLDAPIKVALNGTAISNSYADLWSVCSWLQPGVLYKNFYQFRNVHAILSPYFPAIVGWRGREEIEKRVAPLIFRKTKEEVLKHLPPLTEQTVGFELSAEEKRVYRQIKEELQVKILGEDMTVSNALVELMRLRQVTNGLFVFGMEEPSSKIAALKEVLAGLPSDAKALIFSAFKTTVNKIAQELDGCLTITGDTPPLGREEAIETFNKSSVNYLAMTAAGERGLNLQAANYIINMDLPWSYAAYDQRLGRAWRTGQKNHVHVYNLSAEGTVDEKVAGILEKKRGTADELSEAVTRKDLQDILA